MTIKNKLMLNLTEPTLLLDKQKCIRNIQMMVEKAKKNNVVFRPHFKTHQSHEVGRWFRKEGVTKITVSSLTMAEYFAQDGWKDITVAIPVNVHEKERINRLASTITLNLLVVDPETIRWLAREVKHPINIFIEADDGNHRSGVSPSDFKLIDSILNEISNHKNFRFAGFLGHAGHSYKSVGVTEILKVHQKSMALLLPLKEKYKTIYPNLVLAPGDTPTCSVAENFEGVDEIRPGNLVFYDVMQTVIGSCSVDQVAVAMACPVIATYPERNEVVIHGGGIHFAKDSLKQPDGSLTYGKVVTRSTNGWDSAETGMYVKSLSQEHGVIHAPKAQAEKIKLGDFLTILPIHSCMTVDCMREYLTLDGERFTTYR
jgi:D-serine deaminase-like pyridoxal phosphate-dependent protein